MLRPYLLPLSTASPACTVRGSGCPLGRTLEERTARPGAGHTRMLGDRIVRCPARLHLVQVAEQHHDAPPAVRAPGRAYQLWGLDLHSISAALISMRDCAILLFLRRLEGGSAVRGFIEAALVASFRDWVNKRALEPVRRGSLTQVLHAARRCSGSCRTHRCRTKHSPVAVRSCRCAAWRFDRGLHGPVP